MEKLKSIIAQLKSCNYECVAGKLENNSAFIELEQIANPTKTIAELTNEDAEEIGYDTAGYFHKSNLEYRDGIGLLTAEDFMYLLNNGYKLIKD